MKPIASFESFAALEVRVGRVVAAEPAKKAKPPKYVLTVDFGDAGSRVSVGQFTAYSCDEIVGKLVVGVLNFEPRRIGGVLSEALILGVPAPGAAEGVAIFLVPDLPGAELGSSVF